MSSEKMNDKDFSELSSSELEAKLNEFYHLLIFLAAGKDKAKGLLGYLVKHKPLVLAEITHESDGKSHAEKERNALRSERWDKYNKKLNSLEVDLQEHQTKFDMCKLGWETIKTIIYSKNIERKMSC